MSTERQVKPPVEFKNGELFLHNSNVHHRIRAWPRPQALISEDGKEWRRDWPEFRFIGYMPPPFQIEEPPPPLPAVKAPRMKRAKKQLEFDFAVPETKRPQLSESEAFELLRQTVPEEIANALAVFSSCQWNPLVFTHFDRGFLDLLKSSPALAFYLANDREVSKRIYRERQTFHPKLVGSKQVDLLDYVGLGCRKQMVGIVKKIRPESADMSNVRELQNVRGNEEGLKRLSHLQSINQGVLALVGEGDRLMSYYTPAFLEEVSHDEASHCAPSAYHQFTCCFRMHWHQHPRRRFPKATSMACLAAYSEELAAEQARRNEAEMAAAALSLAQAQANREAHVQVDPADVARMIQSRREAEEERRRILNTPFPAPPLPNTENIQALVSDAELMREGEEQRNCVGIMYRFMVRTRSSYVYRILKPERATVSIIQGGGRWWVQELKACCNKEVHHVTKMAVKEWLNRVQVGVGM